MKTKMNNKVKALLMACCAVLLVFASVLGTLAYLTDTTEKVTNTFTVGKVDISLDEAKVNKDGDLVNENGSVVSDLADAARGYGNSEIRLVPANKVTKDPTITVASGSEKCWVRVKVVVTFDKTDCNATAYEAKVADMFNNIGTGWTKYETGIVKDNTITYEYRYSDIVDEHSKIPAVFGQITVPASWNNDDLTAMGGMTIDITAHAIQAEGLDDVNAAWAAFPTT